MAKLGNKGVLALACVALLLLCTPFMVEIAKMTYSWYWERIWEETELHKQQLERYTVSAATWEAIPYYVVSLKRAKARRAAVAANLRAENVTFEFFDAVDGSLGLPQDKVDEYVGTRRQYNQRTAGDAPELLAETGCALSHLLLMERAIAENHEIVVHFEDDAVIKPGFKAKFLQRLTQLPVDWDILYLFSCHLDKPYERFGRTVGSGIRVFRWGVCTNGFAYRQTGAAKLLHYMRTHQLDEAIDLAMARLSTSRVFHSYLTDPQLVKRARGPSFISSDRDIRTDRAHLDCPGC